MASPRSNSGQGLEGMRETEVYIAGPLFSEQDRVLLERIAEEFEVRGYATFLPHRDAGDLFSDVATGTESRRRQALFEGDVVAVRASQVLVALLDGADVDSGTSAEMGLAYALGKPIFAICTDRVRRQKKLNNIIFGFCEMGTRVYPSVRECVEAVNLCLGSRQKRARVK